MKAGGSIDFEPFPAVTREQLRAYADASGDFNPIHLDEEAARKAGLPDVIAHGMLIAALVSERALRYVTAKAPEGAAAWRITSSKFRFRAMTLVGDVVSVGGTVKSASDAALTLDLQARNQRGETVAASVLGFGRLGP